MKRNPRAANRAQVVAFFEYLAAHGGEVASRLASASRAVWVARGDGDEVGLTERERAMLRRTWRSRRSRAPRISR